MLRLLIKVNGRLTERKLVKDVEMQGSVWGSIKCTTTLDKINQFMLDNDELKYRYKGDTNIDIGVLGMVDDTIAISKCGIRSIQKNTTLNSFIEAERLTLSSEKVLCYMWENLQNASSPVLN